MSVPAVRGLSLLGVLALSAGTSTEALAAGDTTSATGVARAGQCRRRRCSARSASPSTASSARSPSSAVEAFQADARAPRRRHRRAADAGGARARGGTRAADAPPARHDDRRPGTVAHVSISTRDGGSGGGVAALQEALGVAADGDFGPQTEAAVRAFQGCARPRRRRRRRAGDAGRARPRCRPRAARAGRGGRGRRPRPAGGRGHTTFISATASSARRHRRGSASAAVSEMIAAGDQIATLPYIYGGGHGSFTSAGLRLLGLGVLRAARRRPAVRAGGLDRRSRATAPPARAAM